MGLMKELNDLNNIYQKMYDVDEAMEVTAADKKGNTPAWQGYKSGKKNVKTGKPLYKAAAHLKNEEVEVDEGYAKPKGMKDLPKGTKVHVLRPKKDRDAWKPSTGPKGSKMKESVVTGTSTNAAGEKIPWKVSTKGGKSTVTDKFGTREMRKASDTVNKNRMRKEELEGEISPEVEKLIESGLFSDAEIAKIADIQEADIADILARLEKKRISKGGDPEESPLPAMKKYHADKKKKAKK